MISGDKSAGPQVTIEGLHTVFYEDGAMPEDIYGEAGLFLKSCGTDTDEIDAVILGINGDRGFDHIYYDFKNNFFKKPAQFAYYKHLCGEYYTSTAFALWLGKTILETRSVPEIVQLSPPADKPIRKLLIYNHFRNIEHSFILLGSDND
jgi:hypothetical protein